MPVTRVIYRGTRWELFKLHLLNLLLNICTLGIYSFWGKTRIRRYITAHITVGKERLDYTGTGQELAVGFMKAMLVYMPVSFALQVPQIYPFALVAFFSLFSLAVFMALRYRLSRTRWRGIRFSIGGLVKEYLVLSLKRVLWNFISVGFLIPKSDIMKWSYIANHMKYGEQSFAYQGDHTRLRKVHLVTLGVGILTMLFFILCGIGAGQLLWKAHEASQSTKQPAPIMREETSPPMPDASPVTAPEGVDMPYPSATDSSGEEKEPMTRGQAIASMTALFSLPGAFVFYIARLWYHAALWQERFRMLRLGPLRFKMSVTGGSLFLLKFVNVLLIVFSLGILTPLALHRTMHYFTSRLKIGGDVSALEVLQNKDAFGDATGDGLATDVGFDMGF